MIRQSNLELELERLEDESIPTIGDISPFFIVRNVDAALAFYRDMLGFKVTFRLF